MKKLFLTILMGLFFITNVFAKEKKPSSELHEQKSEYNDCTSQMFDFMDRYAESSFFSGCEVVQMANVGYALCNGYSQSDISGMGGC